MLRQIKGCHEWIRSVKTWSVYLLKCSDNSLYCGVTNDLANRLAKHADGSASKYTRSRRPVTLAASRHDLTKKEAFQLEYRIKKLPAARKISTLKQLNLSCLL